MPVWARVAFSVVVLTVLAFAVLYLYRRLVRDVAHARWVRWGGGAFLVFATVGSFALRGFFHSEGAGQAAALALATFVGLVMYVFLAVLAADLFRWLSLRLRRERHTEISESRRLFLSRAVAVGSVAAGSGLASFGIFRAYEPAQVSVVPIRLPGLPKSLEGFSLVQLSDVHIGSIIQRHFIDDLVERANSLKPDLVAITGDLVDGKPHQLGEFVARLKNLSSRWGTHFVSGNHDYYSGWESWAPHLSAMGFTVLRNRSVVVGDTGGSFDLFGVEDHGSRFWHNGYNLQAALSGRDPQRASVLLSHQPSTFDDAAAAEVGLQLSGHTHGGQLFPGTGIVHLLWGNRAHGLSQVDSSQLYVSRGCGFIGPPMRLGSPPELVKIVLLPG